MVIVIREIMASWCGLREPRSETRQAGPQNVKCFCGWVMGSVSS